MCALVAGGLSGLADPVAAEERAPSIAALRRAQRLLLERAKERYDAGRGDGEDARRRLESALDALHLAYALEPAPWLLFNMAQVQSQLGQCDQAAALYHRFLASDPAAEAKASAEAALELLHSCAPEADTPSGDALAPGLRQPAEVEASATRAGAVDLVPAPLDAGAAGAEPSADLVTALPWAFGSLAVISGVAGAVYWSEARSAKRELDALRVAGPEVLETRERGRSAQSLARVFGGASAGFALAAAASYFWLWPEPSEAGQAAALDGFWLMPLHGGAGAGYHSEF